VVCGVFSGVFRRNARFAVFCGEDVVECVACVVIKPRDFVAREIRHK
jgi:hypothetical protein